MNMHRPPRDELHPMEQDYIGKVARVEVPLRSVMALRRTAADRRKIAQDLAHPHRVVSGDAGVERRL